MDERYGFSSQLAEWSRTARQRFVPNPDANTYPEGGSPYGNYFAWSWGDALFVVLDPYTYSTTKPEKPEDWTLGERQMHWLESLLASSKRKWKIIFQHQLVGGSPFPAIYGNGKEYPNYGRGGAVLAKVGQQKRIHDLMVRYGGQIIFKGHDHIYANEAVDGVRYITAGRLLGKRDSRPSWTDREGFDDLYPDGYLCAPGYVRVEVGSSQLKLAFIDSDGRVRDHFQVDDEGQA
jgi:hypothetical protein